MSKPLVIQSAAQFTSLLSSSTIVVTDFHAQWCGPCHQIAPIYEQLAARLSRPNKITFTKVDVDQQKDLAQAYQITAMPTFMVFKNGNVVTKILGADPKKLSKAVEKLAAEAGAEGGDASGGFGSGSGSSSGAGLWLGASLPKGYNDVTNEVDAKGLDLLNADSSFGSARVLFEQSKPSGLAKVGGATGKGKEKSSSSSASESTAADWVESDTDEQLMLYMPFNASLRIHSLQITSLPSSDSEGQDTPLRPKELKLYTNTTHVLGFEEAEDIPPTQEISLAPTDWDETTGTAKVELRFVKFQNVNSLVLFVVSAEGEGEKVRIDRIRIVGEAGKKREMGKLEKVGEGDD